MNSIAITAAAGTTVESFVKAAAEGSVKFYRLRDNGTYRHIPFLADGSKDREVAEWVADQREQGTTMKAIATDMHMSVPSVRRVLNSLLLTEEVEEYDTEEIAEILEAIAEVTVDGNVVEAVAQATQADVTDAPVAK